MNMKLLLESFKSYTQELLSEIKMEQVLPRFESKAFIKAAENFTEYFGDEGEFKGLSPQQKMGLLLQKDALPQDIEEKYKPEALNWLISYFIKYPDQLVSYIQEVRKSLEIFYQIKQVKMDRILSKNNIYDIDGSELFSVVEEAEADWYEYNQSKADKNYQAGTNKIYEDENWEVYIPENKGAACKLGKGTEWCTAAPGLDYYKKYHSPEDPLIIFISKQDPTDKYQFHYGTRQFMNKKDVQLDEADDGAKYFQLHSIVANSDKVPEDIKQQAKRYAKGYQKLPDGGYLLKFVHKSLLHDEYYDEDGNLNREDGPAVILYNNKGNVDTEMWYQHGLLYRKGEPALIYYTEDTGEPYWKVWYEAGSGLKHRNDGPASVREFTPMAVDDEGEWKPAGEKTVDAEYFWQGRSVPKKEYERLKSEYEQRNNSLQEMIKEEIVKVLQEKWSAKYKKSINCKNPKGFSQRAHCQGKKKNEGNDPKVGTGKKPEGSGRRLYTDEDPSDTVSVKFSTVQDIKDTLSKESFKSKSHARQSQIINLIHQRARAAYQNAKDPEVKARLKKAYEYAEQRKEASKEKTASLQKEEQEVQLNEKCWEGYTQKGMKTMFGKEYPNCVKKTKGK